MKKIFLFCLILSVLMCGCGRQKEQTQTVSIGNPWSDWETLAEAEAAVGFSFGLPTEIGDSCTAEAFRTMSGELLEVIYRSGDSQIRVRKQKGEGQDISGDYTQYDICTQETIGTATVTGYRDSRSNAEKLLISCGGYSWSVTAPDGFHGACAADFVNRIPEP